MSYFSVALLGAAIGALLMGLINEFLGAHKYYRHWYLMCRDTLELIDDSRARITLNAIGERRSEKEQWEKDFVCGLKHPPHNAS